MAATLAASALGEMVGRVIDAEKLVAAPAPAARGWVAARALAIIAAIVAAGTAQPKGEMGGCVLTLKAAVLEDQRCWKKSH